MFISSKLLAVLTLKQKSKALSITHSLMFSAVASTLYLFLFRSKPRSSLDGRLPLLCLRLSPLSIPPKRKNRTLSMVLSFSNSLLSCSRLRQPSTSSNRNPDRVLAAACLRCAQGNLLSLSFSFSFRFSVSCFVEIPSSISPKRKNRTLSSSLFL
jgi:hypothetical protein